MLVAFIGFASWTVGDAIVRYLNDYPTVLIACLSSTFSVLFAVISAPYIGGFRKTFTDPKLGWRLFRGLLLAVSGFFAFVAFARLELTTAYAIIFAAPFVAKILSVIIMKEHIRPRSWAITALGFAGVLIVLRPGMVPVSIGALAALALAFFFGLGYVLSRYIGAENQTFMSMSLFQYFFLMLGTAYPAYNAFIALPPELALSLNDYLLLIFSGAICIYGSMAVAYGFIHGPSAIIAPIHYTQILWGVALGAWLFGEYPDAWTLAGGSVIVGAGLLLIRFTKPV